MLVARPSITSARSICIRSAICSLSKPAATSSISLRSLSVSAGASRSAPLMTFSATPLPSIMLPLATR